VSDATPPVAGLFALHTPRWRACPASVPARAAAGWRSRADETAADGRGPSGPVHACLTSRPEFGHRPLAFGSRSRFVESPAGLDFVELDNLLAGQANLPLEG
jgi:hypothetical protein